MTAQSIQPLKVELTMIKAFMRWVTNRWLKRYRKSTEVSGVRAVFLGDYVSTQVILHGVYERGGIATLERIVFPKLKPNSVCLDIGANIGNHSVAFSKNFGSVIAFEPNPIVFHLLQANAVARNIQPVNIGLSSKTGQLFFEQDFQNFGASHIVTTPTSTSIKIEVNTLDQEVAERSIEDVSFVKIDVEGHELEVLQGAEKLLTLQKPVLAMEALYSDLVASGQKVEALLRSYGYKHFYRMTSNSKFVQSLEGRDINLNRSALRFLVTQRQRNDMSLEEINTIGGHDNPLIVVSSCPFE
jgi:FkbM family methyltransferase